MKFFPPRRLIANLNGSADVLCEKRPDDLGNFRTVFFQSEMSGVQQMQFCVRHILQKRFRAGWSEYGVVLAPDHQHGGLLLT